jgi:acyl-CoA thioesterase FadM
VSATDTGLVETYRGSVSAWECDVFGHLNIGFYADRFADAALDLIERLMPAAGSPAQRWRTASVNIRYVKELRAGDGIVIRSGLLAADDGGLRIGHEALDAASGEPTTLVEHRLRPREAALWPAESVPTAVAGWTAPAFESLGPLQERAGPLPSGRDRVRPAELDDAGHLLLSGYVHRFSGSCLHVLCAIGMTPAYMREAKRGFSTFETRLEILGPEPRAGEGVALASGLLDVGKSSFKMLHAMHAARSGAPLATFYQAGVHFDLEARRSSPMPDALREKALAARIGR